VRAENAREPLGDDDYDSRFWEKNGSPLQARAGPAATHDSQTKGKRGKQKGKGETGRHRARGRLLAIPWSLWIYGQTWPCRISSRQTISLNPGMTLFQSQSPFPLFPAVFPFSLLSSLRLPSFHARLSQNEAQEKARPGRFVAYRALICDKQ